LGEEDEHVREEAKSVIRRGLNGDPSVTKLQLDAARSVFSFRAEVPPQEPREREQRERSGKFRFSITDLVRTSCERGMLAQLARPEDQAEVAQLETRLAELLPRESISVEPPEPPEAA
jgi:hypothetical protein